MLTISVFVEKLVAFIITPLVVSYTFESQQSHTQARAHEESSNRPTRLRAPCSQSLLSTNIEVEGRLHFDRYIIDVHSNQCLPCHCHTCD